MWKSRSKCQRIRALVNTSHKLLKISLAPRVKKLGPASVAPKLGEYPHLEDFFNFSPLDFLDLDNFHDLANFSPFDFSDFLIYFTPSSFTTNSLISLLPLFLHKNDLLLFFLLKADLLPLFLLGTGSLGNPVVFRIKVSGTIILLKPWTNCW